LKIAPRRFHPYQQALRILGKTLETRNEGIVLIRQDRAVGSSDEREHLDEMVVVIIDREIRLFHRSAFGPSWITRKELTGHDRAVGCRCAVSVLSLF
jgi:hypothetical protein